MGWVVHWINMDQGSNKRRAVVNTGIASGVHIKGAAERDIK
jgi:hypothetical protein